MMIVLPDAFFGLDLSKRNSVCTLQDCPLQKRDLKPKMLMQTSPLQPRQKETLFFASLYALLQSSRQLAYFFVGICAVEW